MLDSFLEDPNEICSVLAVTLKELLVDKIGEIPEGVDQFGYTSLMKNVSTGEDILFMIYFDLDGNYVVEQLDPGKYPSNKILFFADNKEDAIVNAAINGHGFFLGEEEGPDEESDPS
jgi:hypothetical protein